MENLWAPWRLSYVANPQPPQPGDDCFVCRGLAQSRDKANLLVWRGTSSAVFLNRFPYNNGHLLIVPRAHKGQLSELSTTEMLDCQIVLRDFQAMLTRAVRPDGFNVGLNLGRAAGAGVPGHLHWHLVPRWIGDTNFMPICTDTKVIAQSLDSLYDLLAQQLADYPGPRHEF